MSYQACSIIFSLHVIKIVLNAQHREEKKPKCFPCSHIVLRSDNDKQLIIMYVDVRDQQLFLLLINLLFLNESSLIKCEP